MVEQSCGYTKKTLNRTHYNGMCIRNNNNKMVCALFLNKNDWKLLEVPLIFLNVFLHQYILSSRGLLANSNFPF